MKILIIISLVYLVNSELEIEPTITQGHNAIPGQFPWHVIVSTEIENEIKNGGGILLNERFVLTAAVNVYNSSEIIHLYFGGDLKLKYLFSKNYVTHRNYNPDIFDNNIAVIRLDETITFSLFIKPIPWIGPEFDDNIDDGKEAIIMGTGLRHTFDYENIKLRWTKVKTIKNVKCAETFGSYITERSLCAEGSDYLWQSACYGDEGSAMVIKDKGVWKFIGIISLISYDGCGLQVPFGTIRVSEYREWITTITGFQL